MRERGVADWGTPSQSQATSLTVGARFRSAAVRTILKSETSHVTQTFNAQLSTSNVQLKHT